MADFAYVTTPPDADRLTARLPLLRRLPRAWLDVAMGLLPPASPVRVQSPAGSTPPVSGWILDCPLTPGRLEVLAHGQIAERLVTACRSARRLGACILGMSRHLAAAGGGEDSLAGRLDLPVTTGRLLGLVMALSAARKAAAARGIPVASARVAVLGATQPAGTACAHIMAREARFVTLVSADRKRAEVLAGRILRQQGVSARWTARWRDVIPEADLVIAATADAAAMIEPGLVKPGAVVCLAAGMQERLRPLLLRRDVTVIADILVDVPGRPDLGPASHSRRGLAGAALAEAMILALLPEDRGLSYSTITVEDIDRMDHLVRDLGFGPAFKDASRRVPGGSVPPPLPG